jgi:hypothetical protein
MASVHIRLMQTCTKQTPLWTVRDEVMIRPTDLAQVRDEVIIRSINLAQVHFLQGIENILCVLLLGKRDFNFL